MKIESIDAYQLFDSRGMPTLEVEVVLENGISGKGLVPSGASTGQFEALELRDGDENCYRGKSVFNAISNVKGGIANAIIEKDVFDQRGIDETLIALDGTQNKTHLGANAILGVSMAVANAAANAKGIALYQYLGNGNLLPLPEIQIIGGGAHANWRTDIQDFLIIATGAQNYTETLEITYNVFHAAGDIFKEQKKYYGLADEGGYWPEFETNEEVFEILIEAIKRAGYTPGKEASISLDIAASDLYNSEAQTYKFALENRTFSRKGFVDLMIEWCEKYPIISIEDPAADVDIEGWQQIVNAIGTKVQIIGDDLFTTNPDRINNGINQKLANSVLIKLNQIGTVTETIDAIKLTQDAGWLPVVSARSGETEDTFISHLAVATNCGQLKVGSFSRSERMVKWNECIRINRVLGKDATFLGARIYDRILE